MELNNGNINNLYVHPNGNNNNENVNNLNESETVYPTLVEQSN